jgi:Uma2 family endonuclease
VQQAKTKLTVDEFIEVYSKLPDAHRYELQDGEVLMSPEPTPYHGRLQFVLMAFLAGYTLKHPEVIVFGPTNVALSDDICRGPDITVTAPGDGTLLREKKIEGSPALLIEVVSPSKPSYDLVDKRKTYCSKQVPEIWFLDSAKQEALFLVLDQGLYREQKLSEGVYVCSILPGLSLDVKALFDLDLAQVQKTAGLNDV